LSFVENEMKFKLVKTALSIDHITLTSDDRRFIKFKPKILAGYKYCGRKETAKSPEDKHMTKSYRHFYIYRNLRTGNKLHVFVDRYNTPNYKTLYAPNITVKLFSSWDNNLAYSDVVHVHNILTEKYNVLLTVSIIHVALDLFFTGTEDPFMEVLGCIKSGRKIEPWQHPGYPNTYFFHELNGPFCLAVYNKREQLLAKKLKNLSPVAIRQLGEVYVTRLESRFRNPYPGLPTLRELATWDFSWIYPRHVKFLEADSGKLGNLGVRPQRYRGLSLSGLRALFRRVGIKNNLTYYLREIKRLADPVEAALNQFRWDGNPDRHPLSVPKLRIRKQRIKFIKL
jgi:hypothetical protein